MSRTFFALSCLAASAAAGTLAFSAPAAARTVTVAVSASFTSLDPYDAPWAYLVYEVGTAGADARLKNFHLRADTGIDFREAYWDESESGK